MNNEYIKGIEHEYDITNSSSNATFNSNTTEKINDILEKPEIIELCFELDENDAAYDWAKSWHDSNVGHSYSLKSL